MNYKVTRRAILQRADIENGPLQLPAGVTFIHVPGTLPAGELPTAPIGTGCAALLYIWIRNSLLSGQKWEPGCSREAGHTGDHVAHIGPGQPIAAWTDYVEDET